MNKARAGLCTIACKDLPISEVIRTASRVGAASIEIWAQPPHIAYPLDHEELERTRYLAEDYDIAISAIGSYFQPGKTVTHGGVAIDIANQLTIAEILGAPLIRVWAGTTAYEDSSKELRDSIYSELREFADRAGARRIGVVLERHTGSLTHGWDSPSRVLEELAHPNIALNYQIPYPAAVAEYASRSISDYLALLPVSKHAHLQNYKPDDDGSLPRCLLSEGIIDYSKLAETANTYDGQFMVEFPASVPDIEVEEAIAQDIAYINSLFEI